MEIEINCIMEPSEEFMVTTHETTGGQLSLHCGQFSLKVTVEQARDIVDKLEKGIRHIQKYKEVFDGKDT